MDVLYVSHCVPWPPDKGERIRAYHSVCELIKHHRVHLACLARSEREVNAESELRGQCASVKIQVLNANRGIVRGLSRLAMGGCFTSAFYGSPELQAYVASVIRERPIGAVILLSSGMASYAPDGIPYIADLGDVDSEKRFQYAELRFGGFLQRLEARRLRRVERDCAMRSRRTFLTTVNELRLFQRIAPDAPAGCAGNGVDFSWFDPDSSFDVPDDLRRRRFLVFVGVLSYFPNSDGVRRFAETVFPELRRHDPDLELFLVGRDPPPGVTRLMQRDGITVTGSVDDVRPYLAAARAVVVPLRVARGIQNKVLEALAMGKTVLASEEICRTFMPDVPFGIISCGSAADYVQAVAALSETPLSDSGIAEAARARFTWARNLEPLIAELNEIEREVESEPSARHRRLPS